MGYSHESHKCFNKTKFIHVKYNSDSTNIKYETSVKSSYFKVH